MGEKPAYLVSDIHLGAIPRETEEAFRRWLHLVKESGSSLIINGDLFDFWFDYRSVVLGEYVRVLGVLADLVDAGVPVTLLGGNHDWWGNEYFEERLGIRFHQGPIDVVLFGKNVHVAHGDGLGDGDRGYRALRRFLRNKVTRWGFRWIHPDLGTRIAGWVSETEARANDPNARNYGRAQLLEEWATDRLRTEDHLHIVALGHTHLPKLVEVQPGQYYVNSGDWVSHRTYVTIDPDGTPTLHEWEG